MVRRNNHPFIGIVLIVFSIFLLFYDGKVGTSAWRQVMWIIPIMLLGSGMAFHIFYFMKPYKNRGMLIPGGMLITYSIVAFICISSKDWGLAAAFWPLLPLGIIIGFTEYSLSCQHRNNIFIPLLVIGGVGIVFLCINLEIFKKVSIIPVLLFIIGVILIIRNNRKRLF
ncbi:MAG: hypothetical protein AB7G87_06735 [Clostridia bacterium]